ncbi:hypothetical protein [Ectobacillus panaciterrae]|uniref:hypothetical protein n=1 Tax=Ectobacillus panaciterrae TaxID=363872 RepID=UPI00040FF5C7|nr:hypothetical protein [Ectobacillus panaciterrae]
MIANTSPPIVQWKHYQPDLKARKTAVLLSAFKFILIKQYLQFIIRTTKTDKKLQKI